MSILRIYAIIYFEDCDKQTYFYLENCKFPRQIFSFNKCSIRNVSSIKKLICKFKIRQQFNIE